MDDTDGGENRGFLENLNCRSRGVVSGTGSLRVVAADGDLVCPWLHRDERSVVVGEKCLLRFPRRKDLLGFLRLQFSREGGLGVSLSELEVLSLRSARGKLDYALRLAIGSSRDVERLLGAATLARGQALVGRDGALVAFRDEEAPFGYDFAGSVDSGLALTLLRPSGVLSYPRVRKLVLSELVFSLPLIRVSDEELEEGAFLLFPSGLYRAVAGYLTRHGIGGEAAAYRALERRGGEGGSFHLIKVEKLDGMPAQTLERIPGVEILVPALPRVLVPLGYQHPLPLVAMPELAPEAGLLVLAREGGIAERLPGPEFFPLLPDFDMVDCGEPESMKALAEPPPALGIRVAIVTNGRKEPADGCLVEAGDFDLLRRLLQRLPEFVLGSCRLAAGTDRCVILGHSDSLRCLPVGILLKRLDDKLYLPVGSRLVPSPPPSLLSKMFRGPMRSEIVVMTFEGAWHFPERALLPMTRLSVAKFYSQRIELLSHPREPSVEQLEFVPTLGQRIGRRLLLENPREGK